MVPPDSKNDLPLVSYVLIICIPFWCMRKKIEVNYLPLRTEVSYDVMAREGKIPTLTYTFYSLLIHSGKNNGNVFKTLYKY